MALSKKKILGISGNTKKKSTCHKLLHLIANRFVDRLEMDIFDGISQLPHFNPELDQAPLPTAITDLRQRIEKADGVLFCSPEYVFSLPGSLKNAIEWNVSTTLFSGKPVGTIIAAASGEKAFASLALIMTTIEAILPTTSQLLLKGAKGKFTPEGTIKDQATFQAIEKVIDSLLYSIDQADKRPTKYLV